MAPDNKDKQEKPAKKSLYARFTDYKMGRHKEISAEDLERYTGRTREEHDKWAAGSPHVGKNQVSGTVHGQGAGGMTHPLGYLGQYDPKFPAGEGAKAAENNAAAAKEVDDGDSTIA